MEATLETLSAYEIERGKPMPDTIHAAVQGNLLFELRSRYGAAYRVLPELALATVPDGTTPDLALYPAFTLDYEHRQARRTDPPVLCVEIQSPSQSPEEMVAKTEIYFRFGVQACWIVQPAMQCVFVYEQPGRFKVFYGDDVLRDEKLGIELPLAAVFL